MTLRQDFFYRYTPDAACDLLGKFLVVKQPDGSVISLMITETEAYHGFDDDACHGHKGKTDRCAVMYGEAGFSYVYFIYGMHYMLNIVTMSENFPAAVLIRALSFAKNADLNLKNIISQNRYRKNYKNLSKYQLMNLLNGPAKVTQALKITRQMHNGLKLSKKSGIYIEDRGIIIKRSMIKTTKRIGIEYAKNSRNLNWRFYFEPEKHNKKVTHEKYIPQENPCLAMIFKKKLMVQKVENRLHI